jgi:hypothetical protein
LLIRSSSAKPDLAYFAARLTKIVRHVVVLQGGMSASKRREVKAQLAAIPGTEERLILATGRYVGEGFDDARLDALFLSAAPPPSGEAGGPHL